ncbi:MAG: hypothetical protein KC646_17085 [Candidatus Cloacimonetes bacterium]|nr:hypothetical protein [Candidatus Cloacimonadota bacterium]
MSNFHTTQIIPYINKVFLIIVIALHSLTTHYDCNEFSPLLPPVLQSFGTSKQIIIQSNDDLIFLAKELSAKKKFHSALHPYMALNRRLNGKYDLDVIRLLKKLKYKDLHLVYLFKTQTYLKNTSKPKRKFLEYICYLESYYNGSLSNFNQIFPKIENDYIDYHKLLNNNPSQFIAKINSVKLDPYQVYTWLKLQYFVPFNNKKKIKSLIKKFKKSSIFYPSALLLAHKYHPQMISKKKLISFNYFEYQHFLKWKIFNLKVPLDTKQIISPYAELILGKSIDYSLWKSLYDSIPYRHIAQRILDRQKINSSSYKYLKALKTFSDKPNSDIESYPKSMVQNNFQVTINYLMYPKLQVRFKKLLSEVFQILKSKNLNPKTISIDFSAIERDYIYDPFTHQLIINQKLILDWQRLRSVLLAGIFLQTSYSNTLSLKDTFKYKMIPHFVMYAYSYYLNPSFVESDQSESVIFPMTYDSLLNFPYQEHSETHWRVFRYQCYLLSKELRFSDLAPIEFKQFIHYWLNNNLQSYIYKNKLE